jgi:hypothetical protein
MVSLTPDFRMQRLLIRRLLLQQQLQCDATLVHFWYDDLSLIIPPRKITATVDVTQVNLLWVCV